MNTEQIIKGLEESVRKIEAHYDARGVPQEKRSIEGKKALELIKWQRDEIKRLNIVVGAMKGEIDALEMNKENLKKENKYLRERLAEEMEHKEDMKASELKAEIER